MSELVDTTVIGITPRELADLRRKAAALDAMENWGVNVRASWASPLSSDRLKWTARPFSSTAQTARHTARTPLEAIEEAVEWLEGSRG